MDIKFKKPQTTRKNTYNTIKTIEICMGNDQNAKNKFFDIIVHDTMLGRQETISNCKIKHSLSSCSHNAFIFCVLYFNDQYT